MITTTATDQTPALRVGDVLSPALMHDLDLLPPKRTPRQASLRRRAILAAAVAAPLLAAPFVTKAEAGQVRPGRLWVVRAYDGESLDMPFRLGTSEGTKRAWVVWSYFWRDIKDHDQAVWIDLRLLDILNHVQLRMSSHLGTEVPLILNSGYRTVERNATLEGAAPNSYHCKGMAGDFRGKGISTSLAHQMVEESGYSCGLGKYTNFTHVDSGPARRWG